MSLWWPNAAGFATHSAVGRAAVGNGRLGGHRRTAAPELLENVGGQVAGQRGKRLVVSSPLVRRPLTAGALRCNGPTPVSSR
jgi:hypothetical protein